MAKPHDLINQPFALLLVDVDNFNNQDENAKLVNLINAYLASDNKVIFFSLSGKNSLKLPEEVAKALLPRYKIIEANCAASLLKEIKLKEEQSIATISANKQTILKLEQCYSRSLYRIHGDSHKNSGKNTLTCYLSNTKEFIEFLNSRTGFKQDDTLIKSIASKKYTFALQPTTATHKKLITLARNLNDQVANKHPTHKPTLFNDDTWFFPLVEFTWRTDGNFLSVSCLINSISENVDRKYKLSLFSSAAVDKKDNKTLFSLLPANNNITDDLKQKLESSLKGHSVVKLTLAVNSPALLLRTIENNELARDVTENYVSIPDQNQLLKSKLDFELVLIEQRSNNKPFKIHLLAEDNNSFSLAKKFN